MSGGWWRAWIPNFLFIPAKKSAVELILLFPLFEVSTERWPLKEGDGDGDVDGDGDEYGDDDNNNNNTFFLCFISGPSYSHSLGGGGDTVTFLSNFHTYYLFNNRIY